MKISVLSVVVALVMTGCTMPTKMAETASGRPEVVINTTDVSKIKALIIDDMLNHGYLVEQDTAYSLVLARGIKGAGEGFLAGLSMGAGTGSGSTKRVTVYNFTPAAAGGTRVVVSSQWQAQSYGQTNSQELAMDGATFNIFYTQLLQFKERLETKPVAVAN